jgi:hypothetical protein
MASLKKYCWVFLIPLLALIYWKKGQEHKISPYNGLYLKDSIIVQGSEDVKTFVMK